MPAVVDKTFFDLTILRYGIRAYHDGWPIRDVLFPTFHSAAVLAINVSKWP
jgi:hypothetical protein